MRASQFFGVVRVSSDFDRDDMDQPDFGVVQSCLSGSDVVPHPGCLRADLDSDGDVDQSDFAIFQRCYSGENIAADPNCAN